VPNAIYLTSGNNGPVKGPELDPFNVFVGGQECLTEPQLRPC